jgi:hypothetical protein
MAVRRQLLERELHKLGFRKAEAGRAMSSAEGSGQQEGQSSHPQAGDSGQHGE